MSDADAYSSPIARQGGSGASYNDAAKDTVRHMSGLRHDIKLHYNYDDNTDYTTGTPFLQKLLSVSSNDHDDRIEPELTPELESHSVSASIVPTAIHFPPLLLPGRSSSTDNDDEDNDKAYKFDLISSSPLTTLTSPSPSPFASRKSPYSQIDASTPTAPRFARKFNTPSRPFSNRLNPLTPSCADHASTKNDAAADDAGARHRYRTRSKLAGVRGWAGVDLGRVGAEEESKIGEEHVQQHQRDKKRKRLTPPAVPADLPPQKKTRLDLPLSSNAIEQAASTPSSNTNRRATRLSVPNVAVLSSSFTSNNTPASVHTRSKPKSMPKSKATNLTPSIASTPLTFQPTSVQNNQDNNHNTNPAQTSRIIRTFPPNTPYNPNFAWFYRRFPRVSRDAYVTLFFLFHVTPTLNSLHHISN
jgi:hypothetical protein